MKETAKEGRLNAFLCKALLLFAAAFVMLCINPRTTYAYASLPMGSEADGYYIDADGNMTVYTDAGLRNWRNAIQSGPGAYKVLVKTLTVNEGVTVIENLGDYGFTSDMPFRDCTQLTTVSLPASLTEIGERSFYNCGALTTVTIAEPSNLTTIGESAFDFDTSLTTINIPASVTTIGESAFDNCRALELDAATLPSGLTAINDSIFADCWKMTGSLTIPDGVTSIGDHAFDRCEALESVTIPASVRSIGDSAFERCKALESVTIPDGVTSIGASAFYYCYKLESVTIPASVTSIGASAFYYCHMLESVTIPASVTSIGASAFERCDVLDSVTMLGETPPTLGDGNGSDNVFKDSGISYTRDKQIYVPKSSIMTYKASWTQWKDYINDAGYAGNIDPTAEDYADTDIDVLGFTEDATVYSVDVEWGAMTFQYENTTWDATAHKTVTGAGWKVYDSVKNEALDSKTDAINRIQLTNHSNAGVKATFAYAGAAGYEDTVGSFATAEGDVETDFDASDEPTVYLDTADNSGDDSIAGTPTKGTVYFMPDGIKEELKKDDGITKWTQLGTITINIVPL